jgi:hypothetical protein
MTDPIPAPASVVTIDQSTIYNLLLEVRDDVREVKHDVAELKEDKVDHEERLRKLEERKFVSPWQMWLAVGSGVTFLGGILAIIDQLSGAA